jgi:hypothetical protein
MAKPQLQIEGMRELRKALRDLAEDSTWRGELREVYRAVAFLVAEEAQRSAHGRSSPRMGHVAAGSIKGKGTTTGATVTGGRGVAWFHGHEFGSTRYRQFPAVRRAGYNLYPAIESKERQIVEEFAEAIEDALSRAFPG